MKNIVKLLSLNKDCRIVIADTEQVALLELDMFRGQTNVRNFLKQMITNFTLLSAINDFNQKISLTLFLANKLNVYCMIENAKFSIEYTNELNDFSGNITELLGDASILMITTGDINTGLHTGTVEAQIDNVNMLFSYYTVQSEQLPSHFIKPGNSNSRGMLIQPLPLFDERKLEKDDREFLFLGERLEHSKWTEVDQIYNHLANVVSRNKVESRYTNE